MNHESCAHVGCGAPIEACSVLESPSGWKHTQDSGWFHFAVPSPEFESKALPGMIAAYEQTYLQELYGK